jgi:hypothetical protein
VKGEGCPEGSGVESDPDASGVESGKVFVFSAIYFLKNQFPPFREGKGIDF